MEISRKVAFITGTGQGIGQVLARDLALAGADIIGLDLDEPRQAQTAAMVAQAGKRYHPLCADLSDLDAARRAVEAAIALPGGFDILANNAGIATSGPFDTTPFERWRKTIEVNLLAPMAICHAALPHLRAKPEAHIVNLASIAGVAASPGVIAYCASKFGITGFTRSLDLELAGTSIGVTAIHPSLVATWMTRDIVATRLIPVIPPEQVAAAILKAIRQNQPTIFVPPRMRFVLEVLPRLLPGLTRQMTRNDAMAKSWLQADKEVPD